MHVIMEVVDNLICMATGNIGGSSPFLYGLGLLYNLDKSCIMCHLQGRIQW